MSQDSQLAKMADIQFTVIWIQKIQRAIGLFLQMTPRKQLNRERPRFIAIKHRPVRKHQLRIAISVSDEPSFSTHLQLLRGAARHALGDAVQPPGALVWITSNLKRRTISETSQRSDVLRRVAALGLDRDREHRFGRFRPAKRFPHAFVAQKPRDFGKRFQMCRRRVHRREQNENEIDGLVINRLEIDG